MYFMCLLPSCIIYCSQTLNIEVDENYFDQTEINIDIY